MRDLLESVGFCALMALLAWLYCMATPEQFSAECDWTMEAERVE